MRGKGLVYVAALLAALTAPAMAEDTPPEEPEASEASEDSGAADAPVDAEETPWSKGVSAARRTAAQALLEEGNALFLEAKHREALAKYREAIESWDHPAIRFNIVRALINLDRPVEAYDNLEAALRYGQAPLEAQVFQEAQNYQRLLRGQIAVIEVSCEQAGANITIDGQEFLSCPGSKTARLRPGNHSIVGEKKGFLTLSKTLVLLPGKKEAFEARLVSLEDATVTERRWDTWKPWAVTGGGAALAGIGLLLQLKAQSDLDQYGEEIANLCGESGCLPEEIPGSTRNLKSQAKLENGIAIGTMIAGGAAVAAGVTMVVLNRPRSVLPDETPQPNKPQVTPAVSARSVGVNLTHRF